MAANLLGEWLEQKRSQPLADYEHLWLQQNVDKSWESHLNELRPYFEAAHLDARECFHRIAGIPLHPLNLTADEEKVFCYPNDLDSTTKSGLFGEVMNAYLIEHAPIVGGLKWQVPVYLFRLHNDAEHYIHELNHGEQHRERVIGRFGNDCIGISIDENGSVVGIITGEAKCYGYLSPSAGEELNKEVHGRFCKEKDVPVNLMRFADLLRAKDSEQYHSTIASLEAINQKVVKGYVRQHIFSLIVSKTKKVYPPTYLSQTTKHEAYTINRSLQTVEIIVPDCQDLIEEIYSSLYIGSLDEDLNFA